MIEIPEVIEEPVHIDGLPSSAYHAHESVGATTLKRMASTSPLHYHHQPQQPDSEALKLGRLYHVCALEPEEIPRLYFVKDCRTKKGKAAFAEFEADESDEREVLAPAEVAKAGAIANAIHKHAGWQILQGEHPIAERSYFWKDAETGVVCKTRPDLLNIEWQGGERILVADLKSSRCARYASFRYDAEKFWYDLSVGMTREGVSLAHGGVQVDVCFFVFEKAPPYATEVYTVQADSDWCQENFRRWLRIYADSVAENRWHSYNAGRVRDLKFRRWER